MRFLTVSLVQIGQETTEGPRGIVTVNAPTSEKFAVTWNHMVSP
jgi:hypothetical protein